MIWPPRQPTRNCAEVPSRDDYERLPEAIKHVLPRKQWLWCSDAEKRDLIRTRTEPEWTTLD